MEQRKTILDQCLTMVDGAAPAEGIAKHRKMASSPFLFYRGSAQLFYRDLKHSTLNLPKQLLTAPLTNIIGDCHTSNFGFLTEEGSHGDTVIFTPNDFDDACIGHAGWDLARYIVSLFLCSKHCQGVVSGEYESEKDFSDKNAVNYDQAADAANSFIDGYLAICKERLAGMDSHQAIDDIPAKHILYKRFAKANKRAAKGESFYSESSLAKAVDLEKMLFSQSDESFKSLPAEQSEKIDYQFSPYVDDHILDIVERLNAGTGSVNMSRYYLLVGPKEARSAHLPLCHLVEVKKQRKAAPLFYFDDLSPVNRLNAAHLTVSCQRKMQRKPDLVLDEVEWLGDHWLVRSRHHAKVGVKPEHIAIGKKATSKKGFQDYAYECGKALALAHCRGDRRSVLFEQAMQDLLPENTQGLINECQQYAAQVITDTQLLNNMIN